MAIELAAVYVPITPSLKGAAAQIQKELGGVDVANVGQSVGATFGNRIMGAVGTAVKVGAVAVGTTIAAGVGTALVKGFQRLNAIDTARAKLTGLGNDAGTVSVVMENALASVRGTAFGLGDAATTAAQLVAAQIQPGEQLQGVLKSVANSAAAAGTGLDEMGSIYAKVASLGKAQNDVLQQVADRGIPIYQSLADQFGVTTEEIFKMASAGEIGFTEFEQAMTSAAGTVADELGNTVGGSWSNFIASLGRIGAGLLGGVFPKIAPSIQGITKALAPLEAIAGTVGERIGNVVAPAMEKLVGFISGDVQVGWLSTLASGVKAVIDSGVLAFATPFALVISVLRDSLPQVGAALTDVSGVLGGALAQILPYVLEMLSSMVTVLASTLPVVLPVVAELVRVLGAGLGGVITALGPAIGPLTVGILAGVAAFKLWTGAIAAWNIATKVATAVQAAFNTVMKANPLMLIVTAIAAVVGALVWFFTETELGREIWANFTKFLGEAWENIVNVATTVWNALASFFTTVWQGISDVVTNVWNGIVGFLTPVFDFIGGLIQLHVDVWRNIFMVLAAVLITIWQWISGIVTDAWNAIVDFVTPIVQAIVDFVVGYFTNLFNFWSGVWNAVADFFTGIWEGIIGFITPIIIRIYNAVSGPTQALKSWWDGVWKSISDFFSGIWNGMVDAVGGAIGRIGEFVGGIFDTVMGAFSNIGNCLLDSGKALIQGFIDGILAMVKPVGDAVGGVIEWAQGFFPNSPARRGPLSGAGWVNLRHSGSAVMEQFGLGISDGESQMHLALNTAATAPLMGLEPAHLGEPSAAATGRDAGVLPQSITLVDADGSILTRARVIADEAIAYAKYRSGVKLSSGVASA